MKTSTKIVLGSVLGVVLTGATLSIAWLAEFRGAAIYTDGDRIHEAARAAPLRSVLWQPATPVGGSINTPADDYEPRLSADGTRMVLVRGRAGGNADLYESRWTPEGWTAPSAIESVNTKDDELGPELSRDGKSLYFYSDRAGGLGGYDLWAARAREDGGWAPAVNLGPNVNTAENEYGPALTPDGRQLYFASNRPRPGEPTPEKESWGATVRETKDRHDYDLYVARLGESGAEPAAAVAGVNTSSDEGAPAMSPAGDFLYFASDRAGGLGGFDIYRARRAGDRFGAVESVGDAVNSDRNDLDPALSMDGFRLHFSSNRAVPGAAAPEAGAEHADYGVWVSHSREVYLERQASSTSLAALVGMVIPWLLLLALALLLALLLARLWQSPGMRGRFRRLSLLAQCLLVSLALHVLIASLLAMWRVGSHISQIMRQEGGTRVILASVNSDGGFADQLRGEITEGVEAPRSPHVAALELATPELASAPVRTEAALTKVVERDAGIDAPERAADPASETAEARPLEAMRELVTAETPAAAPAAAPREEAVGRLDPRVEHVDATPALAAPALDAARARVDPRATRLNDGESRPVEIATGSAATHPAAASEPAAAVEIPAAIGEQLASAPPVAAPGEAKTEASAPALGAAASTPHVGQAQVALHSGAADVRIDPAATTGAPEVTIDVAVEGRADKSEASKPPAGGAGPAAPALAMVGPASLPDAGKAPAPRGEEREGGEADGMRLAAAPSVGAPNVGAGRTVERAETGAPATRVSEGGAPDLRVAAREGPAPRSEPVMASMPAPAVGGTSAGGVAVAVPSIEPAQLGAPGGKGEEKGESVVSPASGAAPVRTAPGSGDVAVRVDPGPATKGGREEEGMSIEVPGHASGERAGSPPAASGDAPELPAMSLAVGLPVAADPPAPKETFEQRAPEVRNSLLEQMGGGAETERAVGLALEWFARHQGKDGRWSGRRFDDRCRECGGGAEVDCDAAMTGMALLCYLGAGHTHVKEGPYRDAVAKGIEFLLSREEASGDLRQGETMYSQSIATVALCEAYAMTRDTRVGDAARRAVGFMCEGVKRAASRRQDERSRADDTSVLGWQVMAMESARRCGIEVPDTTFQSAARFLDQVSARGHAGRYSYAPGEAPSAAMTAEAMFVRQLMGAKRDEAPMKESAAFILESPPRWRDGAFTYYWYYATLALFQHQGEEWNQWNRAMKAELLAHQHASGAAAGSWDPQDQWSRLGGRIYQTAVCTLSLEVYYRYKAEGRAK